MPPAGSGSDPRADATLLEDHLGGDSLAFGLLFNRHRDRLWAVALRTTGSPEDAADALQEAMIAAFRRAGDFRGDAAVTTWLHRIVVNASLDRLRRNKVRAADPIPDDLEEQASRGSALAATESTDPEQRALAADRRARVLAALDLLAPDQKAALVLVDMEGYPVQEAAAILQVPGGTVKSRCARGRARLAVLLADLRLGAPLEGTGPTPETEGTAHRSAASHPGDPPAKQARPDPLTTRLSDPARGGEQP